MNGNPAYNNLFKLRVLVVLSGVLLMIGGMVMVFMDLKSEGSISIKTPIFAGSINATYIGLLVIFMGVVLAAVAMLRTFTQKDHVELTRQIERPSKHSAKARQSRIKDGVSEEELKKVIEERLGIPWPEALSLADPKVRSSMQAVLNGDDPGVNKETFKFRSETSGARLASTR